VAVVVWIVQLIVKLFSSYRNYIITRGFVDLLCLEWCWKYSFWCCCLWYPNNCTFIQLVLFMYCYSR